MTDVLYGVYTFERWRMQRRWREQQRIRLYCSQVHLHVLGLILVESQKCWEMYFSSSTRSGNQRRTIERENRDSKDSTTVLDVYLGIVQTLTGLHSSTSILAVALLSFGFRDVRCWWPLQSDSEDVKTALRNPTTERTGCRCCCSESHKYWWLIKSWYYLITSENLSN